MGFAIVVPNANQSPGLFPTQANNNFQRIFDVVNTEHVFNTVFAANDGCHRQVTTINRTDPVTLLAGTNGIMFSKISPLTSASELYWYNGIRIQQMTALEFSHPLRITGTALFTNGQTQTIFPAPTYDYTGTLSIYVNNDTSSGFYTLLRNGANVFRRLLDSHLGTSSVPTIQYSGADITATNTAGVSRNLVWSLIINRI